MFNWKWLRWILSADREMTVVEKYLRLFFILAALLALLYAFISIAGKVGVELAVVLVVILIIFLIWRARRMPKSTAVPPPFIMPTKVKKRRWWGW